MTRDDKIVAGILVAVLAVDYLKKRAVRNAVHSAADTFKDLLRKLKQNN